MRIPVRIRDFPWFVRQVLERGWVTRRPLGIEPTFHLCFFSCHSYFKYLYCSLHSLATHAQDVRIRVLIFSDEEMPLSQEQAEAIESLFPGAKVIPWPKSMGWGYAQIRSIWRAYALAATDSIESDFIVRVDSDVFFFNDRIFQAVARSNADFVGDGHFVDFKYFQGGCYFFRASAVRQIAALLDSKPIEKVLHDLDPVVEDVAAYQLAKQLGLKTWMTWFMMFPDELRKAGCLTRWARWKFSCLHFVMKNKAAMLETYDTEILGKQGYKGYRSALEIV